MATRRVLLAAGGLGLVFSAAAPVGAGTPAELEGGVYGGSASGAWACGPSAQLKYGGIGARGRAYLSERKAVEGKPGVTVPDGFSVGGGLAGEYRRYKLLHCNPEPCSGDGGVVPPSGLVGAASLSAGYDARWIGVRAGLLMLQRYKGNKDAFTTLQPWPELALRVGRLDGIRGELGSGSYSIDTMLRPGLVYAGLTLPLGARAELTGRIGSHMVIDGKSGALGDVSAKLKVGESGAVQLGGGLAEGDGRVEPHARLVVGSEF